MALNDPTRRDVLASLGVGAAAAWWLGCGGTTVRAAGTLASPAPSADEIRAWLAAAVVALERTGAVASGQAWLCERLEATIDPVGRGVRRWLEAGVELRAVHGDRVRIACSDELTSGGVTRLATTLGGGALGAVRLPPLVASPVPALPTDGEALRHVDRLAARADAVASSRIVHRGVRLSVHDEQRWCVAADRDVALRRRASVLDVVLVGWTGTQPQVAQVRRGAPAVIDDSVIDAAALAAAAGRAVELFTPSGFVDGDADVLLTPETVARLAVALADAPGLANLAGAPTAFGAAVGLRDEPLDDVSVGAEFIDAVGQPAVPGVVLGRDATSAPARLGGNLAWAAGTLAADDLARALGDGYLVEGTTDVELLGDMVALRVARARRYRAGAPTGHVFADVALSVPLPAMLAAMRGASTDRASIVLPAPTRTRGWRSVMAPAVITRARLWQVRR